MLCHEVKVDESVWKEHGMDGAAVTAAYRKAIVEQLKKLKMRGFTSERKYDGTRVLGINEGGSVTLQNRHGVIYTAYAFRHRHVSVENTPAGNSEGSEETPWNVDHRR